MSTNTVGPVPVAPSGNSDSQHPQATKTQPTKTLPTDRINVSKQLDILRAYAAASNNGTRAASVSEAAEIVKMATTTVSIANSFLNSVGLIQRTDAGSYMPSPEVLSFLRAYEWNPETASHKLGPVLKDTWFGSIILPRVSFGQIEEEQVIGYLADAANAGPEYKKQLRQILEFMVHAGLIVREAGQVKGVKNVAPSDVSNTATKEPEMEPTKTPGKNVATVLRSNAGGVTFNVDVQVDMEEFATWRPERIQAFFRGIAEVLAAKADVEKGGQTI